MTEEDAMKVHETSRIGWMAICRDIPGVLCFNTDPDVQKRRRADGERYLFVAGYPFSGDFTESVVIAKSRAAIQSYIRGFNKYQSGGFANLRPVKVKFGIELISNFTPRSNLGNAVAEKPPRPGNDEPTAEELENS